MAHQDENSDHDRRLEDPWTQKFFAYLAEKTGGNEAWGHLLFGGNPVLLVRLAAAVAAGTYRSQNSRNARPHTGDTSKCGPTIWKDAASQNG